jgi:DNA processing protein
MDLPDFTQATAQELLGRSLNEVEEKNAPAQLFVAGDVSLLRASPRVSVVGARRASAQGLSSARIVSAWLAERGIIVVSGLAEGVDTMAHETAITAGGRTIAVLGTALPDFYPARNRALQLRIMREHLAVSQFAPGVPTRPANFPMRNRTMALLSDATVIVEAGEKSGSLHQGWEALRLGRPLFIVRSQLEDPTLAWPRELARYGAQPLDVDAWETLTEVLPEPGRGATSALAL